eukprot:COSAG01_NODE_4593_length_4892_cov_3.056541_5_plen_56_part_00
MLLCLLYESLYYYTKGTQIPRKVLSFQYSLVVGMCVTWPVLLPCTAFLQRAHDVS